MNRPDPHDPDVIRGKLLCQAFLVAVNVPDQRVWSYLDRNNVDIAAVTDIAGPIGCFSVEFIEDGFFNFNELGEAALCHIVHHGDAETPSDIVAWSMTAPHRFAVFRGAAGILGIDQVLNPASYYSGKPCRLWSTPLRWLQANCSGAVILDASLAQSALAKAPGRLAAENRSHAAELTRAMPITFRSKPVLVPTPQRAA